MARTFSNGMTRRQIEDASNVDWSLTRDPGDQEVVIGLNAPLFNVTEAAAQQERERIAAALPDLAIDLHYDAVSHSATFNITIQYQ